MTPSGVLRTELLYPNWKEDPKTAAMTQMINVDVTPEVGGADEEVAGAEDADAAAGLGDAGAGVDGEDEAFIVERLDSSFEEDILVQVWSFLKISFIPFISLALFVSEFQQCVG